jgi:hypothetical protein
MDMHTINVEDTAVIPDEQDLLESGSCEQRMKKRHCAELPKRQRA